jgi:hypothetical protein
MEQSDFFIKTDISSNIRLSENLLKTGVFSASILRPFQEPVFISIILKLDDTLQKFDSLEKRINFSDDINIAGLDVTDLVNKIRNAICHTNSQENLLDKKTQIKFVFNIVVGKGSAISIDGKALANSEYEDDIAFFYGEYRIYLRRHIFRLLEESKKIYKELYPNGRLPFM